MNPDTATTYLNWTAGTILVTALVIALRALRQRIGLYRDAERVVPVLVKRDFGLLLGLAIVGFEAVMVRVAMTLVGIDEITGWPRFLYVLQNYLVILVPIIYWVKVELYDVDDYHKE